MSSFRRAYGAGPLHLLLLAGCFAFAGYVVGRVVHVPYAWMIGVFFVGAIVVHDFVLFPLYASVDRSLRRRGVARPRPGSGGGRAPAGSRPAPSPTNHVRVPALLSGLLLLMFFPLVLGLGERTYRSATGLDTSPYLGRWLGLTAGFFLVSGLLYAGRIWKARRAGSVKSSARPLRGNRE